MISLINEIPWVMAPAALIASMIVISIMVWVFRLLEPALRALTLFAMLAMSLFLTMMFIF